MKKRSGYQRRGSLTPRILSLYEEGLPPTSIARLLGCKVPNVYKTLQRNKRLKKGHTEVRIKLTALPDDQWRWLTAEAKRHNVTPIELARAMLVDAIFEAAEEDGQNVGRTDTGSEGPDLRQLPRPGEDSLRVG